MSRADLHHTNGAKSPPLVFITGATGHIGFRVLAQLLEAGYRVRIASRKLSSAQSLATLPSIRPYYSDNEKRLIEFIEIPDFLSPSAFANGALDGATYIMHVASPVPDPQSNEANAGFDLEADYLAPAKDGTVNLLNAAIQVPSIKRIVITSSVAALLKPGPDHPELLHRLIGPNNLANVPSRSVMASNPFIAYQSSKLLALKAAEEFMATHHNLHFSLIHILPSYVQGRIEAATSLADVAGKCSNGNVVRFVLGQHSQQPDPSDFVHVEDVAAVHVRALESKDLKGGERVIAANNRASGVDKYNEVEDVVRRNFAKEVQTGLLPLGGKANPTSVLALSLGYDTRISEEVLGVKYKGFEEMVHSVIGQAVELLRQ